MSVMSGGTRRTDTTADAALPSDQRDIFLDQLATKLRDQYGFTVEKLPPTRSYPAAICAVNEERPEELVEYVGCSYSNQVGWRFVWQGDGWQGASVGPVEDIRGCARIIAVALGRHA